MLWTNHTFSTLSLTILLLTLPTTGRAKSVYVISDTETSHIQAYKIDDANLVYQTDYVCESDPSGETGAVGLAIDTSSEILFVTFEGQNVIELVNAKTMGCVDTATALHANNLAGIVLDSGRSKVYVADRRTNHLYVYSWARATKELTLDFPDPYYVELQDCNEAYGLAFDEENDRLYVGDNTTTVKYYDANDPNWSKLGQFPVTDKAVGIAVDVQNQYVYTGSVSLTYITQYDLATSTETRADVGSGVRGIAVDQDTGLVYITTDVGGSKPDSLLVYDANLVQQWDSGDIGNPAGVAVEGDVCYKPPLWELAKDNNDPNNDCVRPWNSFDENYLIYDICYDANGHADTNVVITDYLAVRHDGHPLVSYYPSDPCGIYDPCEHTVTWRIDELGANDSNCIKLTVKVTGWATSRYTIKNLVAMEGDTYYNEATEDVNVCAGTGAIIYVDKDANDANGLNDGRTWDDAYTVLQDAFTAACNDFNVGAIWVAGGETYKPTWDAENMTGGETFELIEGVALFGHFGGIGTYETRTTQRKFGDPNNETILDGLIGEDLWEAVYNVVTAKGIEDAIVDGFTIQNSINGSGILLDSANISVVNCKLKNNRNRGIACINQSSPDIHNCLFMGNFPDGIYSTSSWPWVSNCIFDGNGDTYTAYGLNLGGSNVGITDCVFKNHTDDGIKASRTELFVTECNFEGNNYHGLYLSDSNLSMDYSLVSNSGDDGLHMKQVTQGCALTLTNSVIRYSGEDGISLNSNTAATTIKNNWIHNSGGAGIYFNSQDGVPLVRNNTIYGNSTYGIESGETGADPNIVNCIIYGNDTGDLYGTFDVNYCCLQTVHRGQGNIVADPCFINPNDPNDLHIDVSSYCKDAGDPNVDYGDETDIDGEARVKYGRVDMGADEYYWSAADFDESENVDFVDYAMFANAWRTTAGDPNYNDNYDLEDNNAIDYNDLDLFCEDWLWEAGWGDTQWMMCMGGGGFGPGSSELMIPDAVLSQKAMPERLAAKSRKFYDVTPATTIAARQAVFEVDIEEILEWLDGFWLEYEELREAISEDEWEKFIEAIEESLKQN